MPGKNGMAALMLALKEAEILAEYIPVHMQQGHTESKQPKYMKETPTVMVHEGQINETTTLPLPNKEDCKQDTSEDQDLGYIKRILSSPEETPIDTK